MDTFGTIAPRKRKSIIKITPIAEIHHQSVVRARRIAMYLVRDMCGMSYPAIGRYFHRDHASVIYAVRAVEELRPATCGYELVHEIEKVRSAVNAHVSGVTRLVAHSACGGCNELRAVVDELRDQLRDAWQLLDGQP